MATLEPHGVSVNCFMLRGELTIYSAEALKAQLLSVMQKADDFELDLHDVIEVDSAGLQMLMAAKVEARKRGVNLRLLGHSKPLLDVFELLNVSAFFGDPLLLSGVRRSNGAGRGAI